MAVDELSDFFKKWYDEEQQEMLKKNIHAPLLDVHTEWVETEDGKRLRWDCPECEVSTFHETRTGTLRCKKCMKIMQANNYSVDPKKPDPENPDWYLEKVAKRRGLPPDEYKEKAEQQSALSW